MQKKINSQHRAGHVTSEKLKGGRQSTISIVEAPHSILDSYNVIFFSIIKAFSI